MSGLPACSRSTIVSFLFVPLIVSRPSLSFGCLKCWEARSALRAAAAFPRAATIPAAAAATAATATAEAASRARPLLRIGFLMALSFRCGCVSGGRDTGDRRLFRGIDRALRRSRQELHCAEDG